MGLLPRRLFRLAALSALALGSLGIGSDPTDSGSGSIPLASPEEITRPVPNPNDAVLAAWADLQTVHPLRRCYVRYLFIPNGGEDLRPMRTSSLAINVVSRATGIAKLPPVQGGMLLRVDLSIYAPQDPDLEEWLLLWEEFSFDPTFARLLTPDTLKFLNIDVESLPSAWKFVDGPERLEDINIVHPGGRYVYPDDSGRVIEDVEKGEYVVHLRFKGPKVRVRVDPFKGTDTVRVNNPGIDPLVFEKLQHETHSLAPVVEHRYFKSRALTTIKDADKSKLFATVFGGLYYELEGVKLARDVLGKATKATDLDLFFENLGIGNIKGGLNYEQLFDQRRSDQAAAIFESGVTGKPREVLSFYTPNGSETSSWGSITGDIGDANIDITQRSFANLLKPFRVAREAIFPKVNGLHRYALFNDKGARQDEVPPFVAHDSMIPYPFTQRLQILGCLTCHNMKGKDGWQPFKNDILGSLKKRLDIFSDGGAPRLPRDIYNNQDVIDRLRKKYTGDFSINFTQAQHAFSRAVLLATGPWPDGGDQTDICKLAATQLHSEYGSYWWKLVDPKTALYELGIDCPKDKAAELLKEILPPDLRVVIYGFVPEDARLGHLIAGTPIPRADWALAYSFALERARHSPVYKRIRGEKP